MLAKRYHSCITLVAIAMLFTGCTRTATAPAPNPEDSFRLKVEAAVRSQLRDPDSAKFSEGMHLVPKADVAMGEVNARNGFGGYAGNEGFIYADGEAAMENDSKRYDRVGKRFKELLAHDTAETYKGLSTGTQR